MEFFHKSHIDFMARRKLAIVASAVAILAGLVSLVLKGGPSYNIDFLGGTEVQIHFQHPKDTQAVRDVLAGINLAGAEIKQFGSAQEFIIRLSGVSGDLQLTDHIMGGLKQKFQDDVPELMSVNNVGPRIGKELRQSAIYAILFSMGLLLAYISVRFDFIFGVGAVIALFHDVLITLGLFSILNREVSLAVVASFLTLIGYSLNDTIVVFDRIRENLRSNRRGSEGIEEIINRSINDTLSRTIMTSGLTQIVVVVCLVFGGEILRDFFLVLFVGIIVGTYSSIFIAAPVVVEWYKGHQQAKIKHKPVAAR